MCETLAEKERSAILERVNKLISNDKKDESLIIEKYLLGDDLPNAFSGYRTPDFNRFTEMIIYFSQKLQPWKTKLNKLLFYADFKAYKETGYSMSGARYCAINRGPVPDNYSGIYAYLIKNKSVNGVEEFFSESGYGGIKFETVEGTQFNSDLFSEVELNIL